MKTAFGLIVPAAAFLAALVWYAAARGAATGGGMVLAEFTGLMLVGAIALATEIITGTFYLLGIALALFGAGFFALFLKAGATETSMSLGLLLILALPSAHALRHRLAPGGTLAAGESGALVEVAESGGHARYRVRYSGALWDAVCEGSASVEVGASARVVRRVGSLLVITPVSGNTSVNPSSGENRS